jgi:hypothetical protein
LEISNISICVHSRCFMEERTDVYVTADLACLVEP